MKFGHFDDEAREYVIETPRTPQPWINYLGYLGFFSIISNTGGGYSFYKDARLRRITRYRYNNIPADMSGKYFYVHDNGDIWNPGWMPVRRDLDRYECRHGLGYTVIRGERGAIAVTTTHFVPLHDECEITRVTVKNTGRADKAIVLFSFAEFCLWNALDDMTNFQRNLSIGEVEVEGSVIYHKTEYRERRNHFAFYSVNCPIAGFDTDRDTFVGPFNGLDNPDAVRRGAAGNSMADGWAPIASHAIRVALKPGQERSFVFVLGHVENPQTEKFARPKVINKSRALAMVKRYGTDEAVAQALDELKAFWRTALSNYHVESPDPVLNRVVNIWNPYQSLVTFNMARSASLFESGISRGIGFRDTLQDLLGMLHQFPERCRERLLECAAVQFADGSCYHQYQPLTKEGNNDLGSNFNDDPMWFVFAVAKYLMETGDLGLLDENVAFADRRQGQPASLFEHLRAAFHNVAEHTGPHGLPLIGRADWNDCLNLNCFSEVPDESFQTVKNKDGKVAESVMIGQMFVFFGREYAAICALTGRKDEAAKARALMATMEKAVLEHGWDGEWFLRAYDDSGAKIGSKDCTEGKVFIETQAMGAMGEIGKEQGYTAKVLDAVDRRLNTEHGAVLVQPAYSEYRLSMGEITSYPEGYKENASIFCHTNIWIVIAECLFGRGDKAYEYYRKFTSPFKEDQSEVHRCEPYVYAEFIAGRDAKRFGQAKNSWLTGTASYCFLGVSQYILGVRPDYDGLVIDPCIPRDWKGFTLNRMFRGAEYRITVRNPGKVSKGVKAMTLNGRPVQGNKLPVQAKGTTCAVDVLLG